MDKPLTGNIRPGMEPLNIDEYVKKGGYESAKKAIKSMEPKEITKTILDSGLKGRGGAGASTGFKMGAVPMGPNVSKIKYLVANGDEMEPGTFKDRVLIEGDPHLLIEGMLIAAYAVQATTAYIFLRGEYILGQQRVEHAVKEAYEKGFLGKNIFGSDYSLEFYVHMSSGRYICGEETALLNALEGRRANPRTKPPYPPVSGLWGKPTLVQNIETFCNMPHIINKGVEWYKSLGLGADSGTKIYGVSGKVKTPGAWELPMGTPMRELLEVHAGGMQDGLKFKALLPGGASTDFWGPERYDLAMDFVSTAKVGTRMGTGTMIVLDDKTCPIGMMLNLDRFFHQESCGWCTPCREGLAWTAKLLTAIENGDGLDGDVSILAEHAKSMGPGHTFCALAPGAASPLGTGLVHFKKEFEQHIHEKRCPYRN